MQAIKCTGRILGWLITALLAVLLVGNLYTIGVRYFTGNSHAAVFGWSCAVVISGSMEPEIGVNDLIVIHEQESYLKNDVITFLDGDSLVTHRIVGEQAEGFITQGDANNTPDTAIRRREDVVGKVVFVIPGVGLLMEYMHTPLGMLIIVLAGLLLLELPYLLDRRSKMHEGDI